MGSLFIVKRLCDVGYRYFEKGLEPANGVETWLLLCCLCADCSSLDNRVFTLALSSIWSKVREFEVIFFTRRLNI